MRSSASSTGITAALYLAPRTGGARAKPLLRLAQGGLVHGEEATTAQDEQGEKAGGDENLADPQGEPHVLVDRGKDDEDALDEDGDPSHEENHHEDLVAGGRPSRQPLQEVGEGDQPAHDESGPGDLPPRRIEETVQEEARLDGHVAVPDHEVREKKKYIHITHMAKVSLAMSWIPDGETWVRPRALARMVRKV